MANIRENSASSGLDLRPTETGIEAAAGAARRGGAFYNQAAEALNDEGRRIASAATDAVGVAQKYMEQREINTAAAKGTELMANATAEWKKITSDPNIDPNDTTIATKFREETLEPALENFKGSLTTEGGQKFAEQFVERYRNQMFKETSSDMSTLAGIAVSRNIDKTVNSLGTIVSINPSISAIDNAIDTFKHTVAATVDSSNLDGVAAASVRSDGFKGEAAIVKAGISSMVTNNPNIDLAAIEKKYAEYLKPGEIKTFQKQAQAQAKSDLLQQRQLEITQRQIADQRAHAATNKVMSDYVSIDPQTNKPVIDPKFYDASLDIVRKNPDAPSAAAAARTMFEFGSALQNKELKVVDDPVVKSDLMTRMFSADKPTTTLDLMKARAEGKISDHTFQAYHGLVQQLEQAPLKGPVWQDTIGAVKGELILSGVGLPGKDIAGESNYAKWAQTFIPQYLAKSRAATLPANALDVKDPGSMISQSMAPFKRTVAQRTQDYLSVLTGAPGARNDAMPAIPPTDQRAAGSIYETPRGKMKWTGTGWVNP